MPRNKYKIYLYFESRMSKKNKKNKDIKTMLAFEPVKTATMKKTKENKRYNHVL
jgi:hypothetical protein